MPDNTELTDKEKEFLELACKRLKMCQDAERENYQKALEDLRFINGDEQWSPAEKAARSLKGRPCLQFDLLGENLNQIEGDARHAEIGLKVRPVGDGADVQTAEVYQGMLMNIEYLSDFPVIYQDAFRSVLECGYGAWRIRNQYTEEDPWVQELIFEPIPNPLNAYLDPRAKKYCKEDAEWGFLLETMSRKDFEDRFPDAEYPEGTFENKKTVGQSNELYYDKDNVTIAEYYWIDTHKTPMCKMEDGQVLTEEAAKEAIKEWEERSEELQNMILNQMTLPQSGPQQPYQPPPMPGQPPVPQQAQMPQMPDIGPKPQIAKRRDTEIRTVKHALITATQILSDGGPDGEKIPGQFIPIFILRGRERNIAGKTHVRSAIRTAKDPQRFYNYEVTAAAETTALAPKAQWLMTPEQVAGHEVDYARSNVENNPIALYNFTDPQVPPPKRLDPPAPPVGIFSLMAEGKSNVKAAMGMHSADLGAEGPERTGAALNQRQKPGDIGTFSFFDNLRRLVNHTRRVAVHMIPEVYDTARDVRIMRPDGKETFRPINMPASQVFQNMQQSPDRYFGMDIGAVGKIRLDKGEQHVINGITKGKYGVVVDTGPSYATQRQESQAFLTQVFMAAPKQMAIALPEILEQSDVKGAQKIAAKLRRMEPPGLQEPEPGKPPPKPMPPSPQMMMAMEKMKIDQAKVQVQMAKLQLEKLKALNEIAKSKGEAKKAVMDILAEVFAPEHPADMESMQQQ